MGGSIQPNAVKLSDIEPALPARADEEDPKQNWMQVLQRIAAAEGPSHPLQLTQLRDDLSNYQWTNDIAYYQHANWFDRHSEEGLYKGAPKEQHMTIRTHTASSWSRFKNTLRFFRRTHGGQRNISRTHLLVGSLLLLNLICLRHTHR